MKINVGGRDGSVGCAQGGRHQKRPQFGVRPRRRLQVVPVAVQVGGDPVAGQIAVVDARRLGIDQGQSGAVDRQQLLDERIGQRGRAGGLAEHRGGQQVVGCRPDIELERAELAQGGARRVPDAVVGLGAQRGRRAAQPGEPLGGDGGEVANILWQCGFHRCSSQDVACHQHSLHLDGARCHGGRLCVAPMVFDRPVQRCADAPLSSAVGPSTSNSSSATC